MKTLTVQQVHEVLNNTMDENIDRWDEFASSFDQVEITAKESFVNGMYVREILIPAGTLLTGRVHKYPYVDVMISGEIDVVTADGIKFLSGFHNMAGVPGRKRAGYAYKDTHWITVHRTDHAEKETILDHLTFFSMKEYQLYQNRIDNDSYKSLISGLGMTEEQVRAISDNEADMIEMPDEFAYSVYVSPSGTQGDGLFSSLDFEPGDHICPARIEGMRTLAGRYSNHSVKPNAKMLLLDNNDMALIAIEPIKQGDEIKTDYRDTLQSQGVQLCQQ